MPAQVLMAESPVMALDVFKESTRINRFSYECINRNLRGLRQYCVVHPLSTTLSTLALYAPQGVEKVEGLHSFNFLNSTPSTFSTPWEHFE